MLAGVDGSCTSTTLEAHRLPNPAVIGYYWPVWQGYCEDCKKASTVGCYYEDVCNVHFQHRLCSLEMLQGHFPSVAFPSLFLCSQQSVSREVFCLIISSLAPNSKLMTLSPPSAHVQKLPELFTPQ